MNISIHISFCFTCLVTAHGSQDKCEEHYRVLPAFSNSVGAATWCAFINLHVVNPYLYIYIKRERERCARCASIPWSMYRVLNIYLHVYGYCIFWPCNGSISMCIWWIVTCLSFATRQWKYNPSVPEFFVEDETTTCLRRSDLTREVATTEVEVSSLAKE